MSVEAYTPIAEAFETILTRIQSEATLTGTSLAPDKPMYEQWALVTFGGLIQARIEPSCSLAHDTRYFRGIARSYSKNRRPPATEIILASHSWLSVCSGDSDGNDRATLSEASVHPIITVAVHDILNGTETVAKHSTLFEPTIAKTFIVGAERHPLCCTVDPSTFSLNSLAAIFGQSAPIE